VALDRTWINLLAPLGGLPATTISRDEFFREVRRTAPDGSARTTDRKTAWGTKACDAVKTATPSKGQCVATELDALERVHRKDQFLRADASPARSEVRDYWLSGALKSVTVSAPGAGSPAVTSYTYDPLVRVATMTDASSGVWRYEYDANDNRTVEDDPTAGRRLEMLHYDALDRVTSRTEKVGLVAERTTTYQYDGPVPIGSGRLYR
jgi:YD repeat-containing protein